MHNWPQLEPWRFCAIESRGRYLGFVVKITKAHEQPHAQTKQKDGPLRIRTLVNRSDKLVGYRFDFENQNKSLKLHDFGFVLGASYGLIDSPEMLLVLSSPHLRILRCGTLSPAYYVVLRRKHHSVRSKDGTPYCTDD